MGFWAVRAGSEGEQESFALERNVVVVGWTEVPNLRDFKSREDLKAYLARLYPDVKEGALPVWAGQLWSFCNEIKKGDLIALPRKFSGMIAFGLAEGDYEYRASDEDACHQRKVKWLDKDFPRLRIDKDVLHSLGSTLTVFRVKRNDAEVRVRALLEGRSVQISPDATDEIESISNIDISRQARDRIIEYIGRKFRTHGLERLVEAVLQAQGFVTNRTDPGPDGGVDILGGRGILGLDSPRIAVQVKSSQSPIDVNSVRELQGILKRFGADAGLFVAWGGYRGSKRELRENFFQIRLWDSEELIDQIFAVYEHLPENIRAELPLQKVWSLLEGSAG